MMPFLTVKFLYRLTGLFGRDHKFALLRASASQGYFSQIVNLDALWQLIDISLLPEHRGRGVGGELIRALIEECVSCGAALGLQVLTANPAMRLYQRLGFVITGEDQMYLQMQFRPA